MERQIIRIDEALCDGCGDCVPGCAEGALHIVDGKARLVSELLCDGLGACLGRCSTGALTVESREAEPHDEARVLARLAGQGRNAAIEHLRHLAGHGQTAHLGQAVAALRAREIELDCDLEDALAGLPDRPTARRSDRPVAPRRSLRPAPSAFPGGGPGVRSAAIDPPGHGGGAADVPSALRHWPIQLHLVNPRAPHFRDARLLVAADCVAFALGAFHDHLGGKSLVIGCPKLDSRVEVYAEKIEQMIDGANLRDITVMAMEVPCCGGLAQLVCAARSRARRYLPVELATVGLRGEILATREV